MNKALRIIFLVFLSLGVVAGIIRTGQSKKAEKLTNVEEVGKEAGKPAVSLIFDSGDKKASFPSVLAKTPYEALETIAQKEGWEIKKKDYDFGVFIEKIGEKETTKTHAWFYQVNGKKGEVAANKYELKDQDLVEWKYEEINY